MRALLKVDPESLPEPNGNGDDKPSREELDEIADKAKRLRERSAELAAKSEQLRKRT
jgi:hypothetical protein